MNCLLPLLLFGLSALAAANNEPLSQPSSPAVLGTAKTAGAPRLEALLSYRATREILAHTNGVANVAEARKMWVWTDWPNPNSLAWSRKFFLRNIPGIAGVSAGFTNAAWYYAATLISPRHYVTTDHVLWFDFYRGRASARFVGTNNIDYWACSLQCTNLEPVYGLRLGLGILDFDMPPAVGFALVMPTNAHRYLGSSDFDRIQAFGYSQDNICWLTSVSRRSGDAISFDGRRPWGGVGWDMDAGGWAHNVSLRAGDSGGPLRTILHGRVVLLGLTSGYPDFSKHHDILNAAMHCLSTNNHLASDYQLTTADLSTFQPQP